MAKARQQSRGAGPGAKQKGRSHLDEVAKEDSDQEVEIEDGMLQIHDGDGAAAGSEDDLADAAVYALDDSDSEGEDEEDGEDSDDVLEEALLRGGKQAQRESRIAATAAVGVTASAAAALTQLQPHGFPGQLVTAQEL